MTKLAKWKTTLQMIAIAVLFSQGVFEHYSATAGGLGWKLMAARWSGGVGLVLLWAAAGLTLMTGWDYFRKALPHLKETV